MNNKNMATPNTIDLKLITNLKQVGALQDATVKTLAGFSIVVCCSDGARFTDLHAFQCKACDCDTQHMIAGAGGPVVGTFAKKDILTHEIGGAVALGKGDKVSLYAHFPCGMANLSDMGLIKVFQSLCDSADHVRTIGGVQGVVKLFHYYDGEKQRTLLVDREKMLKALEELRV